MTSKYFEKLKLKARQVDDNTEKLVTAWKLPRRFIGGCAEYTKETDSHVEALWNTIKDTQVEIEKFVSEIKGEVASGDGTLNMDQFLQECTEDYNDLKAQCDNLDVVLAEYGYRYNDSDILDETAISNGSES